MNLNHLPLWSKLVLGGIFFVLVSTYQEPVWAAKVEKSKIPNIVENCTQTITTADLIAKPSTWLEEEICFEGIFHSFSALALDYPPALRSHQKYISLTLLRPNTRIPLSELKLVIKIKQAQKHSLLSKAVEGDLVKIKGIVFADALGEPWVDIQQIKIKQLNHKFK